MKLTAAQYAHLTAGTPPSPAPPGRGRGRKPPAPLEGTIQKAILEWLAFVGIKAWRANAGAMSATYKGKRRYVRFSGVEGISDLIGLIPGRLFNPPLRRGVFMGIECKRPGESIEVRLKPGKLPNKKQTRLLKQAAFRDMVNDSGGISFVARSVECVRKALEAEGVIL